MKCIPNLISVLRIFCAPLFLFALSNNSEEFAFSVILIGTISDFFDGYFARKYKAQSKFGELLDPIADKIFTNVVLWGIYFYREAPFPILLVAISLTFRDLVLLFGGFFTVLKRPTINMTPVFMSKVCTMLVFVLCILTIMFDSNSFPLKILSMTCVFCIVVTFFIYVKRFFNI